MDKRLCVHQECLRSCFQRDDLLVTMKAESYMGIPLWDSKGEPLGLIAIMDTKPLQDVEMMKEVVQTVALRTAHELERRRDGARLAQYYNDLETTVAERTAELIRTNERLAEVNAENASINEKLHNMTGMVTHDIANQLVILNGYLSLLEERMGKDGSGKELTRMRRSLDLISKTIRVARDYRNTGAVPTWQAVAPMLEALHNNKLQVDPGLRGLSLYADPLLEKVFFDLLDNSEKHGGQITTVTVTCIREDDVMKVIWQDDGIGVPSERKSTLFDPPTNGGHLHGLFLLRKILEQTGIQIMENGRPGEGARFEIVVPAGSFRFTEA